MFFSLTQIHPISICYRVGVPQNLMSLLFTLFKDLNGSFEACPELDTPKQFMFEEPKAMNVKQRLGLGRVRTATAAAAAAAAAATKTTKTTTTTTTTTATATATTTTTITTNDNEDDNPNQPTDHPTNQPTITESTGTGTNYISSLRTSSRSHSYSTAGTYGGHNLANLSELRHVQRLLFP